MPRTTSTSKPENSSRQATRGQTSSNDARAYTLDEVAEQLHCSRRTVERLVADGMLKVFRPRPKGRMVRVSAEALQQYRSKVAA